MKKIYIAILSIVTVICIIAGTMYHVGGFAFGLKNLDQGLFHNKDLDYSISSESTELGIQASTVAIEVVGSLMDLNIEKGDRWMAEYESVVFLQPTFEVEIGKNGVDKLVVSQPKAPKHHGNDAKCQVTITVPENTNIEMLNVNLNLGDMDLVGLGAKTAKIQLDLGDMEVKNCTFEESTIQTDLGEMKVLDSEIGDAEIGSDLGDVKVLGCSFHNLNLEADLGNIELQSATNLDNYRVTAEVDLGDLSYNGKNYKEAYEQAGIEGTLIVKANLGDVTVTY